MKNKLINLVTLTVLAPILLVHAEDAAWEYRDWSTERIADQKYRYSTHGEVVWGNTFGFLVDERSCNENMFWLTISTYEKGLSKYVGNDVKLGVQIDDGANVFIDAPLDYVHQFTDLMDIGLFSSLTASNRFIDDLKQGKKISFTIVEPREIAEKFDIKTEKFSLSGFTAHHLKAREACKNGVDELALAPSISKEEIRRELIAEYELEKENRRVEAQNLVPIGESCDDYFAQNNRDDFEALLVRHNDPYTLKGPYIFLADGSDGGDTYPGIEINNLCDVTNPLHVAEIIGTEAQVNKMHVDNDYLYVVANNASRRTYIEGDPGTIFQIIDIRDLKAIRVIGEYLFDNWSNFKVYEDRAYIEQWDQLLILDISEPSEIKELQRVELNFVEYGSDEVEVTEKYILVTGNNVLKILDKQTYELLHELKFDFRTSDLFVKGDYVYVLGWRNDMQHSKIAAIDISDDHVNLHSIIDVDYRIWSFDLVDGHIVGSLQMTPDDYEPVYRILDKHLVSKGY